MGRFYSPGCQSREATKLHQPVRTRMTSITSLFYCLKFTLNIPEANKLHKRHFTLLHLANLCWQMIQNTKNSVYLYTKWCYDHPLITQQQNQVTQKMTNLCIYVTTPILRLKLCLNSTSVNNLIWYSMIYEISWRNKSLTNS